MGFGVLFIGYLMLFNFRSQTISIDVFCDLVGYIIMYVALRKLGLYNRGFRYAKYATVALMPCGVLTLFLQIVETVGKDSALYAATEQYITPVYAIILPVMWLVFHVFLYTGIFSMAREVGLRGIAAQSLTNLGITFLYYVLVGLFRINPNIFGEASKYFRGPVELLGYLWIILGAICIFRCYMRICEPGDETMPMRDNSIARIIRYRRAQKAKKEKEQGGTPEEESLEAKRAYNAEMQRRQQERTKKSKRGKKH